MVAQPGPLSSRAGPTLGAVARGRVQQHSQERREAVGWASASPGTGREHGLRVLWCGFVLGRGVSLGTERRGWAPCCVGTSGSPGSCFSLALTYEL